MIEFPSFVWEVVAMMLLASIGILIYGLLLTRPLLTVLRVPATRLMPAIFVLCTIGSFAIASRVFDIWVMLGFGLAGFVLREMRYPMAPLVLGLVLGDILDKSLRRGLVLSDGSLVPFLTRPISLVLWATIAITVLLSIRRVRLALARLVPGRHAAKETS
jgi:putative tricarboxylic transport membrane protein